MNITITPKKLSGSVNAVSSKSDAHRKIICASLCGESTEICIRGVSKDIEATLRCVKALGAKVDENGNTFKVSRGCIPTKAELLCGESGSTARFLLPVAAAVANEFTMRGEGRLPKRPFTPLVREMRKNGCGISDEFLPLTVNGKLCSGEFNLEGNVSSQYISGLLMALPILNGNSRINLLTPLESCAYVDMTVKTLDEFGIKIQCENNGYFIEGGQEFVSPKRLECDGDWSNAAFFLAVKCAGCNVEVLGLDKRSAQGDKVFLNAAESSLVDVSEIPDLVPPLAVVAAAKRGDTVFENASRLRLKESDRLASVSDMINSLGGSAEICGDSLVVHGNGFLRGGIVNSYSDHRIVMAAAVASVIAHDKVTIVGAEAADKSYPSFFEDFKSVGGEFYVEY